MEEVRKHVLGGGLAVLLLVGITSLFLFKAATTNPENFQDTIQQTLASVAQTIGTQQPNITYLATSNCGTADGAEPGLTLSARATFSNQTTQASIKSALNKNGFIIGENYAGPGKNMWVNIGESDMGPTVRLRSQQLFYGGKEDLPDNFSYESLLCG